MSGVNNKKPVSIIQTRTQTKQTLQAPSNSKAQDQSPSNRKVKKPDGTPHKGTPPTAIDTGNTTASGYVCDICKNSESIRNSRLKLESDLLITKLNDIGGIKENIMDSLSKFDDIDLHLQHLLTTPKFDNYQCKVQNIENSCNKLVDEILILNRSIDTGPTPRSHITCFLMTISPRSSMESTRVKNHTTSWVI